MSKIFEKINFPLCLAPMVGLSHVGLRRLLRDYLPPEAVTLWPTEMLSSRRLPNEKLGETAETKRLPQEDLLVPQILGNQEDFIRASVQKLEQWGADGIDINMGCPVQKALKHNYGVALMGDANYAADVVMMTVRSTTLPVSVKLRVAGEDQGQDYFYRFVDGLEKAGVSWLTLHPRTSEQKRRGSADWQQIKNLKERVSVPVVGNGDIQTCDDVFRMKEETGCDLVMSGRALAARPWMLWQVGRKLGFQNPVGFEGNPPETPQEEAQEYGRALVKMIDYCAEYFPPDLGLRKVRFYIKTTHVWLDFGHPLWGLSNACQSLPELRERVIKFFEQTLEMKPYTELRQ